MIDYVALMLVNMAAGFFLLAWFVAFGLRWRDGSRFVAPFAVVGLVATICGFHMTLTWPLPGAYNIAFGEPSVMLGMLFLGAALCLYKGWRLGPLAIYAFFAGVAAVCIGFRILSVPLTKTPIMAGVGFILSGLAGVMALPMYLTRRIFPLRYIAVFALVLTAVIWSWIGYNAFLGHLASPRIRAWTPAPMRAAQRPEPPKPAPPKPVSTDQPKSGGEAAK